MLNSGSENMWPVGSDVNFKSCTFEFEPCASDVCEQTSGKQIPSYPLYSYYSSVSS